MNKNFKKVVTFSIISVFIFSSSFGIIAKAEKRDKGVYKDKKIVKRQKDKKEYIKEKIKEKKDKQENRKEKIKAIKKNMDKEDVKKRYEQAKKIERLEDFQALLSDIRKERKELEDIKEEMKKIRLEMKRLIKKRYSEEELNHLRKRAQEIEKENIGTKVIPVENIIKKKGYFKFDTPPVIKQGRTLIPVRAITEGLGANVTWNGEERKVTVSKGDIEIIFQLEDGKVFVDGEEKVIDVPAQIMNNRTIVPLRFIAEELGLKVDYDGDTGTIEIDEEDESEDVVEEQSEPTVTEAVYENN